MPATLANASGARAGTSVHKGSRVLSFSAGRSGGEKASPTPAEAPVTSPEKVHGTTRRSGQPITHQERA